MSGEETFFIGELAERADVRRDTIRYYESLGVLPQPPRSGSGYRLYGSEDVERLEFVGRAQTLGLKLDEIAEVLEIVDEGREPCVHVRDSLAARLDETRARMRELRALERRLEVALRRAERNGGRGSEGCRCRIIEAGRDGVGGREGCAPADSVR